MVLVEKLDELGKPAWIALVDPRLHGLVAAGACISGLFHWERKNGMLASSQQRPVAKPHGPLAIEDGTHAGEDGPHARQDGGRSGGAWWGSAPSSGNRAFDDYRTETLQRLEEEQREFKEFLERLRFAKDRAEFDQFMSERRNRPPSEGPATAAAAGLSPSLAIVAL